MQSMVPLACFLSVIRPPGIQFENALLQISPVDKSKCPFIKDGNDIGFQLYTRHNPITYQELMVDDDERLFASNMDFHAPTVLYFHAFMERPDDGSALMVKEAYMQRGDVNLIMVDAQNLEAGPWYFTAAQNTWYIGRFAAQFIDYLVTRGLNLNNTHLVGHSLGGQAAGVAGSAIKAGRVARITALDPALPLFSGLPLEQRLDPSDAQFVDVIHTDAGIFGYNQMVGHVDFFPNGGKSPQPGCELEVVIPQQMLFNKCDGNEQAEGFYIYYLQAIDNHTTHHKQTEETDNQEKYLHHRLKKDATNNSNNTKNKKKGKANIEHKNDNTDYKYKFKNKKLESIAFKHKRVKRDINITQYSTLNSEKNNTTLNNEEKSDNIAKQTTVIPNKVNKNMKVTKAMNTGLDNSKANTKLMDREISHNIANHTTVKTAQDNSQDKINEEIKYNIAKQTNVQLANINNKNMRNNEAMKTGLDNSQANTNLNDKEISHNIANHTTVRQSKENSMKTELDKSLANTNLNNKEISHNIAKSTVKPTKIQDTKTPFNIRPLAFINNIHRLHNFIKSNKNPMRKANKGKPRQKRFLQLFKSNEEDEENFIFKALNFLIKNRKNIVPVVSVMREITTLVKSGNGELNHVAKESNNYVGLQPPEITPVTYTLQLGNENGVLGFFKRMLGFGNGDRLTIGNGK